jgi:hypothetical protein
MFEDQKQNYQFSKMTNIIAIVSITQILVRVIQKKLSIM